MRLTFVLLLCLVVTAVFAKDKSKRKDRPREKRVRDPEEAMLDAREGGIEMDDDDDEYETVDIQVQQEGGEPTRFMNPCNVKKCKRGEVCVLEEKEAFCVCQTCDTQEEGDRVKVCSTSNVTYNSECELDREHCLCKQKQPGCSDTNQKKIRLDYYSACKVLEKCPEDQFKQFSGRMRDWLFRIMRELANRSELDEYIELLESATNDDKHADAVMWKFCDLDIDPEDRRVTRRELMYIIASIKPMERCLVPFLNTCDEDKDNSISLVEWGTCLGINHETISDKCHHVHQRRG